MHSWRVGLRIPALRRPTSNRCWCAAHPCRSPIQQMNSRMHTSRVRSARPASTKFLGGALLLALAAGCGKGDGQITGPKLVSTGPGTTGVPDVSGLYTRVNNAAASACRAERSRRRQREPRLVHRYPADPTLPERTKITLAYMNLPDLAADTGTVDVAGKIDMGLQQAGSKENIRAGNRRVLRRHQGYLRAHAAERHLAILGDGQLHLRLPRELGDRGHLCDLHADDHHHLHEDRLSHDGPSPRLGSSLQHERPPPMRVPSTDGTLIASLTTARRRPASATLLRFGLALSALTILERDRPPRDSSLDPRARSTLSGRALLIELYDAAVAGAAPGPLTARALHEIEIPADRRVWIFAMGKAAHPMASAAIATLHESRTRSPAERSSPPSCIRLRTLRSTRSWAIIRCRVAARSRRHSASASSPPACRSDDVAIVLISGGATSLIGAPLRGLLDADLVHLYELLLGSGSRHPRDERRSQAIHPLGRRPPRARARARAHARLHRQRRCRRRSCRHRLRSMRARSEHRARRARHPRSVRSATAASRHRCASTSPESSAA